MRTRTLVSAFLLLVACFPALAEKLPEWVDLDLIDEAVADFSDDDVIQLLHDCDVRVQKNGWHEVTIHKAYYVRRGDGGGSETSIFVESPTQKLRGFRAWRRDPGGRVRKFDTKMTTQSLGGELYTESREIMISVPGVAEGSVIAFEVRFKEFNHGFPIYWMPLETSPPLELWELTIQLPKHWEALAFLAEPITGRLDPAPPQETGKNSLTWIQKRLPGYGDREPYQPSEWALAPVFLLRYGDPRSGWETPIAWKSVSDWFREYSLTALDHGPELASHAATLSADAGSGLERAQRIADFVRKSVRYVQIYLDDGGWRPHPATSVYAARFGDCKDMAHLTIAMLREGNIRSYPVLTNLQHEDRVWPGFPMPRFDHCIVAIDDPTSPDQLLYFDPTAKHVEFGRLLPELEGAWGLVVGSQFDTALVRLPASTAAENLTKKQIRHEIGIHTSNTTAVSVTMLGQAAYRYRARLADLGQSARVDWLQEYLDEAFGDAELIDAEFQGVDPPADSLTIRYTVYFREASKAMDEFVFFQANPGASKQARVFSNESRRRPIRYPYPYRIETTIDVDFPEQWTLTEVPESIGIRNEFALFQRTLSHGEGVVRIHRLEEVRLRSIPASDYPLACDWDSTRHAVDRERLVFKRY